ncbi:TPA: hypothetical protein ACH3X1_011172 [Trebouxia sp. C0004]
MDVFETMQSCATNASECCCNPDLVTYSSIVSACQKSLQWEKALDVYEVRAFKQWHMQVRGRQDPVAPLEAHMCKYTPSDLAETASVLSHYDKLQSQQLLQGMKAANVQPNAYVYSSLISACEDSNQWEKALAVFSDMKASNVELDAVTMAGRKLVYMFPGVLSAMPAPIVSAAKIAVKTGRAARQWISPS